MKDTGTTDWKPPFPAETAAITGAIMLSDAKSTSRIAVLGDFCNKICQKRT